MAGVVEGQLDRLGGRRPEAEGHPVALHHGAIAQLGRLGSIERIEGASALHQGGSLQDTVGIGADSHQLTLEQGLEIFPGRQGKGGRILEVRIFGLLLGGQSGRGQADIGEIEHPIGIGLDGARVGVIEANVGLVLAPLAKSGYCHR